jgi:hypothetical protein
LITGDPPAFTTSPVAIENNDPDGTCTSTEVVLATPCNPVASEPATHIPEQFALEAIYPNPFALGMGEMRYTFRVAETGQVQVAVFDVLGRKVVGLVDDNLASGTYEATWNGKSADGRRISAGTYFVRMKAEGFKQTQNITVVH